MGTPAPTGRMDDWRFELPPSAIAQHPAQRREDARLLVVGQGTEHRRIADLPQLLQPGDLLVVNDTRVRPARLFAHKATGGRVELLLVHPTVDGWAAYVRPSKKVPPGTELRLTRRGDGAEGPPIIVGAVGRAAAAALHPPPRGPVGRGSGALPDRVGA
jgi:S-adenosylmethionine:tRNA ribosyltransferase-isomerase